MSDSRGLHHDSLTFFVVHRRYYLGFRLIDDGVSAAVARRRNEMSLGDFQEVMALVGGVKFDEADVAALERHARTCESPACLDWLHVVLLDDEMVDTFAARHPLARGRNTCWEQCVALFTPTPIQHASRVLACLLVLENTHLHTFGPRTIFESRTLPILRALRISNLPKKTRVHLWYLTC